MSAIRDAEASHLLTPQHAALRVINEQPSQIAALGALTLLARERGREAPAPSQGAIDGAGEGAP